MSEKKKSWIIECTDEEFTWLYELKFTEPVTKQHFENTLDESRDNRFRDLTNEEFMKKHKIKDFKEIRVDSYEYIEPIHYEFDAEEE